MPIAPDDCGTPTKEEGTRVEQSIRELNKFLDENFIAGQRMWLSIPRDEYPTLFSSRQRVKDAVLACFGRAGWLIRKDALSLSFASKVEHIHHETLKNPFRHREEIDRKRQRDREREEWRAERQLKQAKTMWSRRDTTKKFVSKLPPDKWKTERYEDLCDQGWAMWNLPWLKTRMPEFGFRRHVSWYRKRRGSRKREESVSPYQSHGYYRPRR